MPDTRALYPPIEPFRSGYLSVRGGHEVYFEQCGNPTGKPVLYLHGGPGGGGDARPRRFFDPERYQIVLFDQRGCGRSRPHACLEANTTWDLISDIEEIRRELGISRWLVFGGSWGSTLALLYAQRHSEHVAELVLRGVFLLRKSEIDWFYQHGASEIFPDAWEGFRDFIPVDERTNLLGAYYRRLTSSDPAEALAAAKAWSIWEGATSHLQPSEELVAPFSVDHFALAFARLEAHYFVNLAFLADSNEILHNVGVLRGIPAIIVQGRYDVVCPIRSAWDLHRAWPEAELIVVPDAGHSAYEPSTVHHLVSATDRFASD